MASVYALEVRSILYFNARPMSVFKQCTLIMHNMHTSHRVYSSDDIFILHSVPV